MPRQSLITLVFLFVVITNIRESRFTRKCFHFSCLEGILRYICVVLAVSQIPRVSLRELSDVLRS